MSHNLICKTCNCQNYMVGVLDNAGNKKVRCDKCDIETPLLPGDQSLQYWEDNHSTAAP